jgi:hypothetical protein
MNLDLSELVGDWSCPVGEVAARVVTGQDDRELVQLRIDMGLLQMFPDGRPDGGRYRGLPSARKYVEREVGLGHMPGQEHWSELQRELVQLNYRRIALGKLADSGAQREDREAERAHLLRAARDTDACLAILRMIAEHAGDAGADARLLPTLLFSRARFRSRLALLEGRIEEAIEEAETGADALSAALGDIGVDADEVQEDEPAIAYLRQLGERLRTQHGIGRTLQEQLEDALEREDYERAAQLREHLRTRRAQSTSTRLPPDAGGQ